MSSVSILTPYGLQRVAEALHSGAAPINITHIAVGSGTPTADGLSSEEHRQEVSSVDIGNNDPQQVVVTAIIPANVGGWPINEIGVVDDTDQFIAVSPGSGFNKPDSTGPVQNTYTIRFVIRVENVSAINILPPVSQGIDGTDIYPRSMTTSHQESANTEKVYVVGGKVEVSRINPGGTGKVVTVENGAINTRGVGNMSTSPFTNIDLGEVVVSNWNESRKTSIEPGEVDLRGTGSDMPVITITRIPMIYGGKESRVSVDSNGVNISKGDKDSSDEIKFRFIITEVLNKNKDGTIWVPVIQRYSSDNGWEAVPLWTDSEL